MEWNLWFMFEDLECAKKFVLGPELCDHRSLSQMQLESKNSSPTVWTTGGECQISELWWECHLWDGPDPPCHCVSHWGPMDCLKEPQDWELVSHGTIYFQQWSSQLDVGDPLYSFLKPSLCPECEYLYPSASFPSPSHTGPQPRLVLMNWLPSVVPSAEEKRQL